jgi:hypothetical protein
MLNKPPEVKGIFWVCLISWPQGLMIPNLKSTAVSTAAIECCQPCGAKVVFAVVSLRLGFNFYSPRNRLLPRCFFSRVFCKLALVPHPAKTYSMSLVFLTAGLRCRRLTYCRYARLLRLARRQKSSTLYFSFPPDEALAIRKMPKRKSGIFRVFRLLLIYFLHIFEFRRVLFSRDSGLF